MTEPLDILIGARERIARGWTQGAMARDAEGLECGVHEPVASCFCALGAIFAAAEGIVHGLDAAACLRAELRDDITRWNDARGRTQAEVLAVFDRVIEKARGAAPEPAP